MQVPLRELMFGGTDGAYAEVVLSGISWGEIEWLERGMKLET
jgi:hypothetical protein